MTWYQRLLRVGILSFALTVIAPGQQPPPPETPPQTADDVYRPGEGRRAANWGWLGIIGLAGLFGLRGGGRRAGDVNVRRAA
jgi:hypothetical protein